MRERYMLQRSQSLFDTIWSPGNTRHKLVDVGIRVYVCTIGEVCVCRLRRRLMSMRNPTRKTSLLFSLDQQRENEILAVLNFCAFTCCFVQQPVFFTVNKRVAMDERTMPNFFVSRNSNFCSIEHTCCC
jgi:hypothetical protein